MFCKNCGKKIAGPDILCQSCGGNKMPIEQQAVGMVPNISKVPAGSQYQAGTNNSVHDLLIKEVRKIAMKEITTGIGWAALGGIITAVTYAMASDGGTYFVFWGLIIVGGYKILKGLYYLASPDSLIKKSGLE